VNRQYLLFCIIQKMNKDLLVVIGRDFYYHGDLKTLVALAQVSKEFKKIFCRYSLALSFAVKQKDKHEKWLIKNKCLLEDHCQYCGKKVSESIMVRCERPSKVHDPFDGTVCPSPSAPMNYYFVCDPKTCWRYKDEVMYNELYNFSRFNTTLRWKSSFFFNFYKLIIQK
jgi:hypothetical protein